MKSSTKIPGIKRQVTLTDRKDFINDTQDEDEEIATVTGPYNDKSFTSIQNSDVDLWDFKALPISPVPTPMMFRSDTRELSRLNSSSSDRVTKILQGNITTRCPIDPKILRIYISSSFADTEAERTALIQKTFPGLKSYSFQNGYELQIMDLHWGLKDWIVDDHTAIESNLRILDKCMEGSRTLCFISFLETKLGPMVLPTEIPKEEFEAIFRIIEKEAETQKLEALEKAAALLAERKRKAEEKARREAEKKKRTAGSDDEDVEDVVIVLEEEVQATPTLNAFQEGAGHVLTAAKSLKLVSDEGKILGDGKESNELNLLRTWYQIDENSIPPVYKLQKISTQIKDILRNDPSKRQAAKSVWLTTSRQILKCLQRFAPQVIKDDDELRKYFMTIPEMEMERGLLVADYPNEQCLWVRREIPDLIEKGINDLAAKDYLDLDLMQPTIDPEFEAKRQRLVEIIESKLRVSAVRDYEVPWLNDGIAYRHRSHASYLDKLASDMFDMLKLRLDQVFADDKLEADNRTKLFEEVSHHVTFCQERARYFQGRKDLLQLIKKYLFSKYSLPLVIYGKSGCGKTSLMAKAAKDISKWLKGTKVATLVKFIGITASSANIRELLRSICKQICEIYGADPKLVPHDYKGIVNDFNDRLRLASENRRLVIFIDSLNQLTDEHEARKMAWLPKELPPYVHIIVSTLPDEKFEAFKVLKSTFENNPESFVEVPFLSEVDAAVILNHFLKKANRNLTATQYENVFEAYKQCSLPLFLKIAFEDSLRWTSFTPEEKCKVQNTVKKAIGVLFGRLEIEHGEPLVRRALGYITAARNGVTENEMEDLLSLDDMVMDDVMTNIKPLIRHCPPVSWKRLRADLNDYLVERSADGCRPLQWVHSQFTEAATERYLLARDKAPSYHKALAEYFSGEFAHGKPVGHSETPTERYISDQPLYFIQKTPDGKRVRVYNRRKLSELPYNLLRANLFKTMKSTTLCNFEFVLAKIMTCSLRSVLEDYEMALQVEPDDADLKLAAETLHLSAAALTKDPSQLASQIVGRMGDIISKDTPAAPQDPKKYPYLHPFYAKAQKSSVPSLVTSMTCMSPPGGVLFDLLSGHRHPLTAAACTSDGLRAITASKDNTMKIWDLRSSRVIKTIYDAGEHFISIRLAMRNALIITSETTGIRIWDIKTGRCLKTISHIDPAAITIAKGDSCLVAFYDGTFKMRVWDLKDDFNLLQEISVEDPDGGFHKDKSIVCSPVSNEDKVLYAFRSSSCALVHNITSGERVFVLKPVEKGALVSSVNMTNDYYIAACKYLYRNSQVIFKLVVFDNKTGKHIRDVSGCVYCNIHELIINALGSHALALSPSEETNNTDVAVWNVETEEHKHLASHATVSTIAACVDLRFVLSGSKHETALRIWNFTALVNQNAKPLELRNGISSMYVVSDNQRYVITRAASKGVIKVWNLSKNKQKGKVVLKQNGLVGNDEVILFRGFKAIILSDRGPSDVAEDNVEVYKTVLVYDLQEEKYDRKIKDCFIYPAPAHEYKVLSDNRLLGLSENRSHFVVWSTTNGHILFRIRPNFRELERQRLEQGLPEDDVMKPKKRGTTARMTPWERRSETGTARDRRRRFELEEEKKRIEEYKKEKDNAIEQYFMSEDEQTIVASFYGHHLCVFDVETQKHLHTLEMENCMMFLHVAALTSQGQYLIHTNYDEEAKVSYITIWDCKIGDIKRKLKNERNVCAIAINNSASRVVFAKENGEIRTWDPKHSGTLERLEGVKDQRFDRDTKIYLLANDTKCAIYSHDISIWDLEKCEMMCLFTPDYKISSLGIGLNGQIILLGLRDNPNIITMQLTKNHRKPLQLQGSDIFGEAPESDSESDDDDEV